MVWQPGKYAGITYDGWINISYKGVAILLRLRTGLVRHQAFAFIVVVVLRDARA